MVVPLPHVKDLLLFLANEVHLLLQAVALVAHPNLLGLAVDHLHLLIGALAAEDLLANTAVVLPVHESETSQTLLAVVHILVRHPLTVLGLV